GRDVASADTYPEADTATDTEADTPTHPEADTEADSTTDPDAAADGQPDAGARPSGRCDTGALGEPVPIRIIGRVCVAFAELVRGGAGHVTEAQRVERGAAGCAGIDQWARRDSARGRRVPDPDCACWERHRVAAPARFELGPPRSRLVGRLG